MRTLFDHPFIQALEPAKRILIAGAGGGFDIFCGLPLYFALKAEGKDIFLANLSFSTIQASSGRKLNHDLIEVTARTEAYTWYFPEVYLARWLREHGEECSIYCFRKTGAKPVLKAYKKLVEELQIDTVILVDGGTDSLMRGDEVGLGTPAEDITSIAAVDALDIPRKFLVNLGFGVDAFHGVCHAYFLEAVAALSSNGGFLGAWSLLKEMPEVTSYLDAIRYVSKQMPMKQSIVNTSIASAIHGHYGNYHATKHTEGSQLYINPLMSLYWAFHLSPIVKRNMYIDLIRDTETIYDVIEAIQQFRENLRSNKQWVTMPF